MQRICWINLYNCQGLFNNLKLDVSKIATILMNQIKNFEIQIILPGSELPLWFSCRKDIDMLVDHIATDNEISKPCISDDSAMDDELLEQCISDQDFAITNENVCKLCIEIPRTSDGRTLGCSSVLYLKLLEGFLGNECLFDVMVTIDRVRISSEFDCQSESAEAESSHVWLAYCSLAGDMKLSVDKMSYDQLMMPWTCQITFSYCQGLLMKSCSVHKAQLFVVLDNDDDAGGEDSEHEWRYKWK